MRHIFTDTFDAATELKDAGAVTANDTAGAVGGVARILSVGTGLLQGVLNVVFDNVKVSATNEAYQILLQASTTANFASDVVNLQIVHAGLASVNGQPANVTTGSVQAPFVNAVDGDKVYPYIRVLTKVVGTSPSISYRAYITKSPLA